MFHIRLILDQDVHKGNYHKSCSQHNHGYNPIKLPVKLHQSFLLLQILLGYGLIESIGNGGAHPEFRERKHIQNIRKQPVNSHIILAERMSKDNPGDKAQKNGYDPGCHRDAGIACGIFGSALFSHHIASEIKLKVILQVTGFKTML